MVVNINAILIVIYYNKTLNACQQWLRCRRRCHCFSTIKSINEILKTNKTNKRQETKFCFDSHFKSRVVLLMNLSFALFLNFS